MSFAYITGLIAKLVSVWNLTLKVTTLANLSYESKLEGPISIKNKFEM